MPEEVSLTVPPRDVPILETLARLPDEASAALRAAASTSDNVRGALDDVIGDPAFESITTSQLIRMMASLHSVQASHDWSLDVMATSIAMAEEITLSDDERSRLRELLSDLFHSEPLRGYARALDIYGDREHIFHTARCYTDIRPVFRSDPQSDPLGMLLSHTLKLEYFRNRRLTPIFISLSAEDIEQLRTVLERASAKVKTLTDVLSAAGLSLYDLEGDR